jgi:hypothetical protein
LQDKIDQIIQEKEIITKRRKKKQKCEKRKTKLVKKLKEASLNFHNDSKLCKLYIENKTDYKINEVVQRMSQIKYLYEYCHMDDCLE